VESVFTIAGIRTGERFGCILCHGVALLVRVDGSVVTAIVPDRGHRLQKCEKYVASSRQLPPCANLKRAFVVAMLEWIDTGWRLGEFSSRTGAFFCTRGVERRQIEIKPTEVRAR
jgi:hypothetical protein